MYMYYMCIVHVVFSSALQCTQGSSFKHIQFYIKVYLLFVMFDIDNYLT